mgnify:CR=1 FL=1
MSNSIKSNPKIQDAVTAPRTGTKSVSEDDIVIGKNIRSYRKAYIMPNGRAMNQSELGTMVGLTFQQVQKYERGTNRVSAGRLASIAIALGVSIEAMYRGTSVDIRKEELEVQPDDSHIKRKDILRQAAKDLKSIKDEKTLYSICHVIATSANC